MRNLSILSASFLLTLGLLSGPSSEASVRTVPGIMCPQTQTATNYNEHICGLPSGTEFDGGKVVAVYADVHGDSEVPSNNGPTTDFMYCRESFSTYTVVCGSHSKVQIGSQPADVWISASGVGTGSSQWDYYWVFLGAWGGGYMGVKGIGAIY